MKTFLAALSLLSLVGCATAVQRSYTHTPEGWVIIYTSDQNEVAAACGADGNKDVIGCALTPLETKYPSQFCDVRIFTGQTDLLSDTLQHELRHCREGAFHAD